MKRKWPVKVAQMVFNSGLSNTEFKQISGDIDATNATRLLYVSIGYIVISLASLFLCWVADLEHLARIAFLDIGLIVVGLIGLLVPRNKMKHHHKLMLIFCSLNIFALLVYGIGLSFVELPRAVTFIALLVVAPLLFVGRSWVKMIVTTIALGFFILATCFNDGAIKDANIVNAVVFWACGNALHVAVSAYECRHELLFRNVQKTRRKLAMSMASIVESRDEETGAHILRTRTYVGMLVAELRTEPAFAEKMTPAFMDDVVQSAPLHDIGKIKVPDSILLKPGRLSSEEFEIIKSHTVYGYDFIKQALNGIEDPEYIEVACNIAKYHHERTDGKGYPEGLKGDEIPLEARIMAIADVYDALTSPRVYKQASTAREAIDIMIEGRGTQFDPVCLDAFMRAISLTDKELSLYLEEKATLERINKNEG